MTRAALADWFTAGGDAGWRARQVSDAIWSGRHASFEDIPQLPAALRARLATHVPSQHAGGDHGPCLGWWPDPEGAPPPG